jgi:serine/threonine protein kinase
MGVVYEAVQVSLRRRVALKTLPLAATLDPKQLQRFRNEAKAAAGLHHEHIVPVYAVGCERGVHYYAMQFIDGVTLAAVIDDFQNGSASGRSGDHSPHGPDGAAGAGGANGGRFVAARPPRSPPGPRSGCGRAWPTTGGRRS